MTQEATLYNQSFSTMGQHLVDSVDQEIYINDSVKAHLRSYGGQRLWSMPSMNDASGSVFFQRDLEVLNAQVFEVLFGGIKFRELFPLRDLNQPGATSYAYIIGEKTGEAKLIGSNVNDLPRASIAGEKVNVDLRVTGTSYAITQQELASGNFANVAILQRKAEASRRANEQLLDRIAFFGDDDAGLTGIFNDPNIPTGNVAGGIWTSKTPAEIILDITDALTEVFENTLENFRPSIVVLPIAQWSLITGTPRSDTTDTTIAQFIASNNPFITSLSQFVSADKLKGAGSGGEDTMVIYSREPRAVEYISGFELAYLAPETRGLEILINGWSATGGLAVYQPQAFTIKEGI